MEIRNKNADPADKKQLPAVIHPNVVVSPHPISSSRGRKLFYVDFMAGESLLEYLDRVTLLPPLPIRDNFVVSYNGKLVTFDDTASIFPRAGDLIVIRARVHGGGDGSSNPLTVVLMIAVIIASQGTLLGGWAAVSGAGAFGPSLVLIGGMLLISALVPIKPPSGPDESTPDPTYSLSGSSNRSRPYEPLPIVFGVVRMYPDHGARPFTTYERNDQKLFQIFNFGLTNPAISDLKIGDSPLENFFGFDIEYPVPSGAIKTFPTNVDTLAGADLLANVGTFITRTSSANTTRLVIDISGINFFVGREEGLIDARIKFTAEYRLSSSSDPWLPFFRLFSGFTLFPLRSTFINSADLDFINGTKEVFRNSYHRPVAEGTYDVRVMLHDLADIPYNVNRCDVLGENCTTVRRYSPRGLNTGGMTQVVAWDQLKSWQIDTGDYTGQSRLGLEIQANAQLNNIVDRFNVIASVTLPTWTGSAWVDAVTSNPAWQFLALARGAFDASGRRVYGAGLDDTRIDIETIKLWATWCDAKGLECNIVMTSKMTVIDMMNTVARVGRGVSTWSNGMLGVIYDEGNKPAVAMFGMSNIVHDSFKVSYISNNLVDEVIVAFTNPDINWQRDTVRVVVPGSTIPVNSVTIELPGVTDEAQAAKEANLIAAEQFYRRRIMSWETDIEGLTVQRGDVAILSHDLTQWDYSGRLISGTTTILELDRDVPFTRGEAHYIGVRSPDGTYEVVDVVETGVENLVPFPEEFDNVAWIKKDIVVIPNNTNAPDGTMSADKIAPTSSPLYNNIHSNLTVLVGLNTWSVYAKAGEYTKLRMLVHNLTDGSRGNTDFDLELGTINSGSGSIESIGDGWFRCSVSATATTVTEATHLYVLDDTWNYTFIGDSFDGIYVWGAMLNIGLLADYINETNLLELSTPLSASPDADVNNDVMDYLWFYGPTATPGKLVKITDITPLSEDRVRILATDEDDDYYLSESDSYTYITPTGFTTEIPVISGLSLGETLIIVGAGFGSRVDVTWDIDGEYGGAFIRAKDQDTEYRDVGRTLDKTFSFEWVTGKTVTVEVTAHNKKFEMSDVSRAEASLLLVGKAALPSDVTNFSVVQNGQAIVIRWTQPPDLDLRGTEIRYGVRGASTWEDATPLTEVTKGTNITSQALPDGDWTMYAKHVDSSTPPNYSANAASSNVLFESDQDIITQVEQAPFAGVVAYTNVSDASAVAVGVISDQAVMVDSTVWHTVEAHIRKDAIPKTTRFGLLRVSFLLGGTPETWELSFDSSTGERLNRLGTFTSTIATRGEYWRFTMAGNPADSANTNIRIEFYPAINAGSVLTGSSVTTIGDMDIGKIGAYDINGGQPIPLGDGYSNWTVQNATVVYSDILNFVVHHTGKLVPQSQDSNSRDGNTILWAEDTVFENFVVNPFPICEYNKPEFDIGFDDTVRVWGDVQSSLGPGEVGVANPLLEIDYRLSAGSYDGYEPWTIGDAELRYCKFKVILDTSVGNAYISGFNPTVDQLEHTTIEQFTIAIGGTVITFAEAFHSAPWGSASAVSATALFATISSITSTQGLVHVYNTSDTSVGGTAVVTLTGV